MFQLDFYYWKNGKFECKSIPLQEVNSRKIPRRDLMYITLRDQRYHKVFWIFVMEERAKIVSNYYQPHGKILQRYDHCLTLQGDDWWTFIPHEDAMIHSIPPKMLRFCIHMLKGPEYRGLQKKVRRYEQKQREREYYCI